MDKLLVLSYIEEKKKFNMRRRNEVTAKNRSCSGLTFKEYGKVTILGKSKFKKKYTNNSHWKYYDVKIV
jgi:hypothetical protein